MCYNGVVMNIERFIGGAYSANGYVITGDTGTGCWVIDPGYHPEKFIWTIRRQRLQPEGILLTHHHDDHTGAAAALKRELDCPVYIHRADRAAYGGPADVLLEGGEKLTLGSLSCRVVHTPGHTKGGVCFYFGEERCCFTGDTIFNVDLGRTDLSDGSPKEMEQTIRKIVDRWADDVRIYPGHGDDCTMAYVREINREFLDIVDRRSTR